MANPSLEKALLVAIEVAEDSTASDKGVAQIAEVIINLYDLRYPGIPDIVQSVVMGDTGLKDALPAIRALRKMSRAYEK